MVGLCWHILLAHATHIHLNQVSSIYLAIPWSHH